MKLDLQQVPFSRFGSYLSVSRFAEGRDRPAGLYLRTVRGDAMVRELLFVEPLRDGAPVPCRETATASLLRLDAEDGFVEFCLAEPKVLRIRGKGLGLRLSVPAYAGGEAFPVRDGAWELNLPQSRLKLNLSPVNGQLRVEAPWKVTRCTRIVAEFGPARGRCDFEAAIEEFRTVCEPRRHLKAFEACVETVERDFRRLLKALPLVPERYVEAAELAGYLLWSCTVDAEGLLKRPGILMSKNWMTHVWSWDHCFNAMALIAGFPKLGWDQFMLLADRRADSGQMPDFVDDAALLWNYVKPPIHGWTLKRMLERSDGIDRKRLKEAYGFLSDWTKFWLDSRDADGDGVPQYHHGNDSGWDNATIFDGGMPVEAPDLAAFLVLQMDVLSEVALLIGKANASQKWRLRADRMLENLLAHSWKGDRFVAPRSGDHHVVESDSLILFLPLLLGQRLPEDVRGKLVAGLLEEGRFLTPHGLATESPRSPLYRPDGYWRGPIWAPPTLMLVEGLAACGEREKAIEIGRRFCDLCVREGFAENFDALTGQGLCDRAYTWTASVFLILAHEYLS